MSNKFKVGDIVTGTEGNWYSVTNEHMIEGKVIAVREDYMCVRVVKHEVKSWIGETYWVNMSVFKLVSRAHDWKVVIIPDGDKTTGKLYENGKVVKEVSTVKSPKDEYSMDEAIKVIAERLTAEKKEEPKPKLYNGKVVCVDTRGWDKYYKVGQIYNVVDGVLVNKLGESILFQHTRYGSFDDLVRQSSAKWIEVIE